MEEDLKVVENVLHLLLPRLFITTLLNGWNVLNLRRFTPECLEEQLLMIRPVLQSQGKGPNFRESLSKKGANRGHGILSRTARWQQWCTISGKPRAEGRIVIILSPNLGLWVVNSGGIQRALLQTVDRISMIAGGFAKGGAMTLNQTRPCHV